RLERGEAVAREDAARSDARGERDRDPGEHEPRDPDAAARRRVARDRGDDDLVRHRADRAAHRDGERAEERGGADRERVRARLVADAATHEGERAADARAGQRVRAPHGRLGGQPVTGLRPALRVGRGGRGVGAGGARPAAGHGMVLVFRSGGCMILSRAPDTTAGSLRPARGPPHRPGEDGRGRAQRTSTPAARIASFTWPTVRAPKWNTLAASTASAPARAAATKCSGVPAPPLATSGTRTSARTAVSISRSKPAVVPSASIELSRISPAP